VKGGDGVRPDAELAGYLRSGHLLDLGEPQDPLPAGGQRAERPQDLRCVAVLLVEEGGVGIVDVVDLGVRDGTKCRPAPPHRGVPHDREQVGTEGRAGPGVGGRDLAQDGQERLGHEVLGMVRRQLPSLAHGGADVPGPQDLVGVDVAVAQAREQVGIGLRGGVEVEHCGHRDSSRGTWRGAGRM
jgi:hypothetical protein